jgi:integrase
MDARKFSKRFAEYLRKAGVEPRVNKPFHRCRDTFASELLSNGTARWLVSEWLGHTEERTTKRYGTWIPTQSNVSAVDTLDSIAPQNATASVRRREKSP